MHIIIHEMRPLGGGESAVLTQVKYLLFEEVTYRRFTHGTVLSGVYQYSVRCDRNCGSAPVHVIHGIIAKYSYYNDISCGYSLAPYRSLAYIEGTFYTNSMYLSRHSLPCFLFM